MEVTGGMLKDSDYDTIIIATGSNPRMFSPVREFYAENTDNERVLVATDYLAGWKMIPDGAKEALVLGAGNIGQEAAYMLAKSGLHVRLLEGFRTKETMMIGDINNAMELMDAMLDNGVEICDHTQIVSLGQRSIETTVLDRPVTMPYDVLLIAQGLVPNDKLVRELDGCEKEVICIGNVVQDRTAFYAMHEGFTAAYNL
jgi:pyruvate/2-oxoglutarate dehydrogenase complex dihydrolipoamide dehydrogenase (E3) component